MRAMRRRSKMPSFVRCLLRFFGPLPCHFLVTRSECGRLKRGLAGLVVGLHLAMEKEKGRIVLLHMMSRARVIEMNTCHLYLICHNASGHDFISLRRAFSSGRESPEDTSLSFLQSVGGDLRTLSCHNDPRGRAVHYCPQQLLECMLL